MMLTAAMLLQMHAVALAADPEIPPDHPDVIKGRLPVTLFGAVPDDEGDDTAAIQKAVDAALSKGYVAFFPPGRYLVSDTIRAMQPVELDRGKDRFRHDRNRANALVGSTAGDARPRLVLADNAVGFDNPDKPKPLVWIWAQPRNDKASGVSRELGSTDPDDEQSNISMNQVFKGIDLDLRASGNRGAVGIRHAGSQGSTLEDVDIYAQGAYAGIMNLPGQGGGAYRIGVHGGDYGIWAEHRTRFPVLAGIRLSGQKKSALFWNGQSNMTIAGFVIDQPSGGPIVMLRGGRKSVAGALTLVDGVIRVDGPIAIDNRAGRSLYLKDVWIKGASAPIRSGSERLEAAVGDWTHIGEYAHAGPDSKIIVDGAPVATHAVVAAGSEPDGEALIDRHVWGSGFPSMDDADVVSVTDFGAKPDDAGDDTAALEKALASAKKVFLPKGRYLVSDTIEIPAGKHLIGVAKHLSIIQASGKWRPEPGTAVVSSTSDAASDATISFLRIDIAPEQVQTALAWRAGAGSVVRDIMMDLTAMPSKSRSPSRRLETYRVTGAGRVYAMAAPWNKLSDVSDGTDYRHVRIRDNHARLAFYGLNVERSRSNPQCEVVNAKGVELYYLKAETLENEHHSVIRIADSQDVAIFGYSGIATPVGEALIEIVSSADIVVANAMQLRPSDRYRTILELDGDKRIDVNGKHPVTLFR
jgi:hypothetical protein